jgi:3-dehydroshikimate dehydratase
MKINICTISFRHSLVSFNELVLLAKDLKVSGIELWYPHAVSLLNKYNMDIFNTLDEIHIDIPMISSYLNLLCNDEIFKEELIKLQKMIITAEKFKSKVIRIFAGNVCSRYFDNDMLETCIKRIKIICDILADNNKFLAVETHPNTFSDTLDSTIKLVEKVDKNNFKINYDILHLWENGDDIIESYKILKDHIINFHLKNIVKRKYLSVFDPMNIYSPSGKRDGIVLLKDGLIDYELLIKTLIEDNINPSLSIEWFGDDPFLVLKEECEWLKKINDKYLNKKILTSAI